MHRHVDKPTDILSFPLHTDLKRGERPPDFAGDYDVGDLYLCGPYIARHCARHKLPDTQSYIARLIAHGLLHLLGYDHIKTKDFKQMLAEEGKLLHELRRQDPTFVFDEAEFSDD
jgi:probable rRNA maturation factor